MSNSHTKLALFIIAIAFLAALIWGTAAMDREAYTETITMPDGRQQSCTFIGYGRSRTLLECTDQP